MSGTATDLAELSGVAFAGAYKELKAMVDSGLAKVEWADNRKVFSADATHPMADLMRGLLKQPKDQKHSNLKQTDKLRENLAFLGLPVNARKTPPASHVTIEALLADAVDLAQSDASVARSLPVLFHKLGGSLDVDKLKHESWKRGNKHRVGFFLELAGELSEKTVLKEAAKRFLDRRYKVPRQFFNNQTELSRQLAENRTPDLAKKWGLQMNMGLDAFQSTYEKFAHGSVPG
ncbi:MAG: hypothetical protein OQJ84_12870 [Xanthomonadales bacterium]|nr:hypothetical protein [Xanthomonadales bacterium]